MQGLECRQVLLESACDGPAARSWGGSDSWEVGGKEELFGEAVVLAPGDVAQEAEALSAGHCCGIRLVTALFANGGIGYAGCSGDPQDAA